MRIISGVLVILLTNITVHGISPTTNIGAVKGETPKTDLKKKFPIGTSGINDDDSGNNSISSFAAAAKTARIASGIQKAAVEKNLLNSLAQREKKEEEKEEKREKTEKRDNIGHNKSTKIKVVSSKITAKTTKTIMTSKSISKKEESDDESEDENTSKSVDQTGQSSAIKKQLLMAVTYMVASRFVMKLDFTDKKIVNLCRVIFACYLLGSQLLFYVIKMRIEKEDDSSIVEVQAAFNMKSLTEKIPMLNNLGPIGDILTTAAAPETFEAPKLTVKEYDLQQLAKLQNELFCEVLSTTFLHFGSKASKPLIFVPLMGLMNKAQATLVQIHIYGMKAVGALKRPFTGALENLMKDQLSGSQDAKEEGKGGNNVDISADLEEKLDKLNSKITVEHNEEKDKKEEDDIEVEESEEDEEDEGEGEGEGEGENDIEIEENEEEES